MKITLSELKRIIRSQVRKSLTESSNDEFYNPEHEREDDWDNHKEDDWMYDNSEITPEDEEADDYIEPDPVRDLSINHKRYR